MANTVRFVYVSAGHSLPDSISRSRDSIYFYEDKQQIWVGDKLFADHIDPLDLDQYLEPYKIKSVEITGDGSFIASASFNEETGKLSLVKGTPPAIAKGTSTNKSATLTPGQTFSALTGTSVSDSTIYDEVTSFTLPAQIENIKIERDGESTKLVLTIESTDGSNKTADLTMFGSAAFTDASSYATAEQGKKADEAMPATNGTATGAKITLASDPTGALEAATKQYVDRSVEGLTGAMHFLGVSSNKIEDGQRNHPKIDGSEVDIDTLNAGDTVIYSPNKDGNYLEFVWSLDNEGTGKWVQLGDETSYAHKDVEVIAGEGISGGGTLADNITITHGDTGSGSEEMYQGTEDKVSAIYKLSVDKFGHITGVETRDFSVLIEQLTKEFTKQAADELGYAKLEDIPSWSVI